MQDPGPLRNTAIALGAIGAGAALAGIVTALTPNATLTTPIVGVSIRVGAILLAISLALPSVRRPSAPALALVSAGLVLVMIRPGLIWAAVIGWVLWRVLRRQERTDRRDS